jgi:hypothetical protein
MLYQNNGGYKLERRPLFSSPKTAVTTIADEVGKRGKVEGYRNGHGYEWNETKV